MKYLLDTHYLLWILYEPYENLPEQVIDILLDDKDAIYFSALSIQEIAIKFSLNKPDFKEFQPSLVLRDALKYGLKELPLYAKDAAQVVNFTGMHKDPFDRMLVNQASQHGVQLITADTEIKKHFDAGTINAPILSIPRN